MILDDLLSSDSYTPVNKSIARNLWFITAWYFWELIRQRKRFWQEEFFFSQKDMFDELWISEHQQRECVKILLQNELISVVKKWVPARYWFKIEDSSVLEKLKHWCSKNWSTSAWKSGALLIRIDNNNDNNNISSFNKEDISSNQTCKGEKENSNQDCNNELNNQDCKDIIINKETVIVDCKDKKERKKKEITFDLEAMFEWFYNSYPRKVQRVAAKKAFFKAMKCDNDIWLLAYAVKKFAKHVAENKVDLKFVKHPAAYLNQEVFRDFEEEFNLAQQAQQKLESAQQVTQQDSEEDYNIKFKRNYEE